MSALGNLLAEIRNRAIRISKLPVKNKWAKIQYQPAKLVKRTNWVVAKLTSPLLAWRLMALRDLSFYFLISNLVAVMLRFMEGRVKTKRVTGKKCPIPLSTFPCPLELALTLRASPSESWDVCRTFLMAPLKKEPCFEKIIKNEPLYLRHSSFN
jgi:hypothetical protein